MSTDSMRWFFNTWLTGMDALVVCMDLLQRAKMYFITFINNTAKKLCYLFTVLLINPVIWGLFFFSRGKKYDRLNIVLLTDLNIKASSDQLDIIIENLKKDDITLQFL